MFEFSISATDGKARVGTLQTPHGPVQTPVFMPVGTHGAVKGISPNELRGVGSEIILGNTYHLFLRPGHEIISNLGGLAQYTGWRGPMLTDSGGFQVFSLGERGMDGRVKQTMRRITEDGARFTSHHDGTKHLIRPEDSITIQHHLGADIMMAFDQPVYGMSSVLDAAEAMRRSMRWLERSVRQWESHGKLTAQGLDQALFGIVQGGVHTALHTESAQAVVALDLPGNAIGGLSVGESKTAMWEATNSITDRLPESKPRYFMGLGDPMDVIDAVIRGVDMYDCVSPTRLARHGVIWQIIDTEVGDIDSPMVEAFWRGDTEYLLQANAGGLSAARWNLMNARFKTDGRLLVPTKITDQNGPYFPLSRAILSHYARFDEMLGYRVLSIHNVAVLQVMVQHVRNAIRLSRIDNFRELWYSPPV
jgi:queuine tRNA-ribosyltransferase